MTRVIAGLLMALLTPIVTGQETVEPGVSRELAEHRAAIISDIHYTLSFAIPADLDAPIPATVGIDFQLSSNAQALQLDFRESGEHLQRVRVNGQDSQFRFRHEHLVIPPGELRTGANRIDIELEAGDSSLNRNPEYLFTLLVPDRARTLFPLFDQPDLKARFSLRLTVPKGWSAMANGAISATTATDNSVSYEFATSELIPSYLFSFVAGRFASVTQERAGRSMTLLHREPDADRLQRNLAAIFDLHAAAVTWLEDYTGIAYPFQKLDFVLIPAFPYGGMEHVGAIQYRADALLLDANATQTELLDRASLIAHEVAHAWFGNLVTMRWFDDVWTKEVFANFMAARIVNPGFPDVDHDLRFLVDHYPGAYGVDRTTGANAIRQELPNLNEAGSLYGAIIYDKAPIMMRQLERLMGEAAFRDGLRRYLKQHAFGNATWPELIAILDGLSEQNLAAWSDVWVHSPGRPAFAFAATSEGDRVLAQSDPEGGNRVWPQAFEVAAYGADTRTTIPLVSSAEAAAVMTATVGEQTLLVNADGRGYGLFPAQAEDTALWQRLSALEKGNLLINLYENLLAGNGPSPNEYLEMLQRLLAMEQEQLLIDLMLAQLRPVFWNLLPAAAREASAVSLENSLWQALHSAASAGTQRLLFLALAELASTPDSLSRVHKLWSGNETLAGLELSERDRVRLAQELAIKLPARADHIIGQQLARIDNPDTRRELEFLSASVAAERKTRDAFFNSLADPARRGTENWVLSALANLHHPLRRDTSIAYIQPGLELLEEIQRTGDIFFPGGWVSTTLRNHNSAEAEQTVRDFLAARPDFNPQLRMKLLQAADPLFRARALLAAAKTQP